MKESISKCCNADIEYVKGSYMGTYDTICCNCGKYCIVIKGDENERL